MSLPPDKARESTDYAKVERGIRFRRHLGSTALQNWHTHGPGFTAGSPGFVEDPKKQDTLFALMSMSKHFWSVDGERFKGMGYQVGDAVTVWPDEVGRADMIPFLTTSPVLTADRWLDFWNVASSAFMITTNNTIAALPAEASHIIGVEFIDGTLAANLILSRLLDFAGTSTYLGTITAAIANPPFVQLVYGIAGNYVYGPSQQVQSLPTKTWLVHEGEPSSLQEDGASIRSGAAYLDQSVVYPPPSPSYPGNPRFALGGGAADAVAQRAPVRIRYAALFDFNVRTSSDWPWIEEALNTGVGL